MVCEGGGGRLLPGLEMERDMTEATIIIACGSCASGGETAAARIESEVGEVWTRRTTTNPHKEDTA